LGGDAWVVGGKINIMFWSIRLHWRIVGVRNTFFVIM